jgi:hypothetical protein
VDVPAEEALRLPGQRPLGGDADVRGLGEFDRDLAGRAAARDDLSMTRIGLVLDCADPQELARFWAAALGYTIVGGAGAYVLLIAADPSRPKLLLQQVSEVKSVKNRMHLDIEVADVEAEVVRLEALGARRVEGGALSEFGSTWQIMVDPESNEFCVCDGGLASVQPSS